MSMGMGMMFHNEGELYLARGNRREKSAYEISLTTSGMMYTSTRANAGMERTGMVIIARVYP